MSYAPPFVAAERRTAKCKCDAGSVSPLHRQSDIGTQSEKKKRVGYHAKEICSGSMRTGSVS